MSLKYAKKSQIISYTILAAIKACNIVFVDGHAATHSPRETKELGALQGAINGVGTLL